MALEALGLNNITLHHLNVKEVRAAQLGQFDYLIAHGLFSWVPPDVQEEILEICHACLAPHGVAYISYNAYPGWHAVNIVRDLMRYHTRTVDDPAMCAAQARDILRFMSEAIPTPNGSSNILASYGQFLQAHTKHLDDSSDAYLLHDHLEEINLPVYFHEFVARARQHELQYLCEAEFSTVLPTNFPPEVAAQLSKLSHNVIEMEQYMDFLRNRSFRKTLVCHADAPFDRTLKIERVMPLYVASPAEPVSEQPDWQSISIERFRGPDGAILTTDHPVTKAAMRYLRRVWPRAVAFDELLHVARAELGLIDDGKLALDTQVLASNVLKAFCYSGRLMELHVWAAPFVGEVSARPVASPWARLEASRESNQLTNLRHDRVSMDEFGRYLLRHLDGAHDRAALIEALTQPLRDGVLVAHLDGKEVTDWQQATTILGDEIDRQLKWLAESAMLIA